MHRLGALALSGDVFVRLDLKTGATFGKTVGVLAKHCSDSLST